MIFWSVVPGGSGEVIQTRLLMPHHCLAHFFTRLTTTAATRFLQNRFSGLSDTFIADLSSAIRHDQPYQLLSKRKNTMAFFNFDSVKKLLQSAEGRLTDIRNQTLELQKQRDVVRYAPATRADVKTHLAEWAATSDSSEYSQQLKAAVIRFAKTCRSNNNGHQLRGLLTLSSEALSTQQIGQGVFELLRPQVLERQLAIIDSVSWPEGAMDASQRQQLGDDLDARIAKLNAEEVELLNSARAAGLALE